MPPGVPIDPAFSNAVLPRLFRLRSRYGRAEWTGIASSIGATATPPTDSAPASAPAVEKVAEAPKEQSLDDLMAGLQKIKIDSAAKPVSDKAAPYAPAYPWRKALELARDPASAKAGARAKVAGE